MTMNGTTETKDTKPPTTTPTRGESAVRHLWKRATEEGRKEDAALIATVANHLLPSIKLTAGLPFSKPEKAKVDSAQIDGSEVDISGMEDRDAADYLQYSREMDGSAARERHIARLEEEDRETREIGRRNGS